MLLISNAYDFNIKILNHNIPRLAETHWQVKRDKFYDLKKAFSVSISKLDEIKVRIHAKITGQQNSLYSAFAKTDEILTIEKMADIEIQAMVNSGVPKDIATGWVVKALEDLKVQGVKIITNIPWNGLN